MNVPHIQWAIETLESLGYALKNPNPEHILKTAWSEVSRFHTNEGFIYLKKVPPQLALEIHIIPLLKKQFQAHVPHVIAQHEEYNCFLMIDAGITLHEYFKQQFNPQMFIEAMQKYTALQQSAASQINHFLQLGVPDWRLAQLPLLYRQLLNEEQLLLNDGLTHQELKLLHSLEKKLIDLCNQLAQYTIPDTFGHADFHDKNILIHPQSYQTTMIDLGEVVITHPFFSFVNCFHRTTECFNLTTEHSKQLQKACFKNWLSMESSTHLFDIISIINQCWPIHAVLADCRLIKSIETSCFKPGRLTEKLRIWMNKALNI
jgi:aminoglycoside/choline kinase family phosphotransferase